MRIANDEKGSCRCLILVTIQELRKIAKNEGILSEGEIFCQKTRRQERTVLHSECEIPYFSEEKKNRLSVKLGLSLRVSDVV